MEFQLQWTKSFAMAQLIDPVFMNTTFVGSTPFLSNFSFNLNLNTYQIKF